MTSFLIRRATNEDSAGIIDCLALAFAPFRESYTPEAFLDTVLTAESLAMRLQEMTIFVAADALGNVSGTISCKVVGSVRGMAVRPEWQGAHLAADLLACAEEELRSAGCSTITLDTTEPLTRAARFYEKHGFQPSGRIPDFFGMPLVGYS
jgi:ribosomal protein S18 acetylase RimI-like enzyme